MITVQEVKENGELEIRMAEFQHQADFGEEQLLNHRIAKELGAGDDDDWDDWEERVQEYKTNKGIK